MPGSVARVRCDVAVVGGGPAGAVAAYILAGAGARVALIVRDQPKSALGIGETVPAQTRALLQRLGLDFLSPDVHLPSAGTMARWGSDALHYREAILCPYGSGWHLDRRLFEKQLVAAAVRSGARLIDDCSAIETRRAAAGWEFGIAYSGRRICIGSSYLVDCTGRSARLALAAGARRKIHDKLIAIWCVAEQARGRDDLDQRIYLESAPDGWLYSAKIPRQRRVIVYFTDGDLCRIALMRTRANFEAYVAGSFHLQEAADGFEYSIVAGPYCVNAASARLLQAYGEGWIAAGDAAQSFDPLSSQGIMSAIIGGHNAAAALIAAHSSDHSALETYQAELDGQYGAYLTERLGHYRAEQRWNGRPFWQRRQGPHIARFKL
jgi:flavin-dependent dehydrogenase